MKDLIIVIPAYNEEGTAETILNSWMGTLNPLNIEYEIQVFNDGSTDNTSDTVENMCKQQYPQIKLINLPHSGFSKTLHSIYQRSFETKWIFRADFDDEIMPEEFLKLWQNRMDVDAVFGIRNHRQNFIREIVSIGGKLWIRILFGQGIIDTNIPFRLLKYNKFKDK